MERERKTFVIGDIHGGYKSLMQVIERSGIDYKKDKLICLGDVADGWSEVPECFDELLKFNNLVYIMGNHDWWLLQWFKSNIKEHIWISQGGQATFDAYNKDYNMLNFDRKNRHEDLLWKKSLPYYIDDNNNLFVHGGFNWHIPITSNSAYDMMWNRNLFGTATYWQKQYDEKKNPKLLKFNDYNEIFIGHTSTSYYFKDLKPVNASNLWNLDQGAGYEGKLTLMNVDTKEYWQSDLVKTLYPDEAGR